MQAILILEAMGYSFEFQNENIKYKYTPGNISVPHEAARFLSMVKANRFEAVRFLRLREHERQVEAFNKGLLSAQAANIRTSEDLRVQINKALNAGAAPDEVLPLALECISRMTGDQLFFTRNMERLKTPRSAVS